MLKNPKKFIAQTDIPCFVVFFNEKLDTPWPDIDKVSTICDGKYAYLGIYSYKHRLEAELFESILKREGKVEIKEAFIPKDSEVYEGTQGWSFPISKEHLEITKYCSSRIKIKE